MQLVKQEQDRVAEFRRAQLHNAQRNVCTCEQLKASQENTSKYEKKLNASDSILFAKKNEVVRLTDEVSKFTRVIEKYHSGTSFWQTEGTELLKMRIDYDDLKHTAGITTAALTSCKDKLSTSVNTHTEFQRSLGVVTVISIIKAACAAIPGMPFVVWASSIGLSLAVIFL